MKKTFRVLICFLLVLTMLSSETLYAMELMDDFETELYYENEEDIGREVIGKKENFGIYQSQVSRILETMEHAGTSTEMMEYFVNRCREDTAGALKRYSGELFFEELGNITNTFFSIAGKISAMYTMVNGFYSTLQKLGVIGGREISSTETLLSTTRRIEQGVQEINAKLNSLENKLDEQYAQMMLQARHQEYLTYQNAWNDFYRQVQAVEEEINAFQNAVTSELLSYVKNWQKSGKTDLRVLYGYDEQGTLLMLYATGNMDGAGEELPPVPGKSKDGIKTAFSITIPGKWIHDNIDTGASVNADTLRDVLTAALEACVGQSNFVQLISDGGASLGWDSMSTAEQEQFAYRFTQDAFDTLAYAASSSALNNNSGALYTAIISQYNRFCDYIEGAKLTSPLLAQHKMLSLTHGFEGEILEEEQSICGCLELLCNTYGVFASMAASVSDLSTAAKEQEIRSRWICSLAYLVKGRDEFITGNDNYCYITESPIEYREIAIESELSAKTVMYYFPQENRLSPNGSLTYKGYDHGDWKIIDRTKQYPADKDSTEYKDAIRQNQKEITDNLVSSTDLLLLYELYKSQYQNLGSFYRYLRAYGAYLPASSALGNAENYGMADTVLTSYAVSDYNLGSGDMMTAYPIGIDTAEINTDLFTAGKAYAINKGNDWSDDRFVFSDTVKGGIFDLASGKIRENETVVSRALYGESHSYWAHDEVSFFTDAENVSVKRTDDGMDPSKQVNTMHLAHDTMSVSEDAAVIVRCTEKAEEGGSGAYTVSALVKDINAIGLAGSGMFNIRQLSIPASLASKNIAKHAFEGVGSKESRVLLRYPNVSSETLLFSWKGGWFGDALVTLDTSYDKSSEQLLYVTITGTDVSDIPCPVPEDKYPEGRLFLGWSEEKGKTALPEEEPVVRDGMTLYAVWGYDHEHSVEFDFRDATCTESGLEMRVYCSTCGLVMSEGTEVQALGHDYGFTADTLTAGKHTCVRCGKTSVFEELKIGPYRLLIDTTTAGSVYEAVSYEDEELMIHTDATVAVINKKPAEEANVPIMIDRKVLGNIVLAGVNINTGSAKEAALRTEAGSTRGINVLLVPGTENRLISGGTQNAGIHADNINSTIRIGGDGKLYAEGSFGGAGIGGCAGVIIDGGDIEAVGMGGGAGIGASNHSDSGNITVNGGTVKAVGGHNSALFGALVYSGAGIGGSGSGDAPAVITINGGTVTAEAKDGAAIGVGYGKTVLNARGGDIRINGGNVNAKTTGKGSALGNSTGTDYDGVYISGGVVTAESAEDSFACDANNVYISSYASVKLIGRMKRIIRNWAGDRVELAVLENASGNTLTADGHELPYKEHMGEKRVYVYIPKKVGFSSVPFESSRTVVFRWNGYGDGDLSEAYFVTRIEDGFCVLVPDDPTADGYTFAGWYLDEACTVRFSFNDPITEDITLYAKWTANDSPVVPVPVTGDKTGLWICLSFMAVMEFVFILKKAAEKKRRS